MSKKKFKMTKFQRRKIKAILFDVDGTLINSGNAHIYSIRETLSEMKIGKKVTDQEILNVIGNPIDEIFDSLLGIEKFREGFIQTFRKKMYDEGGIDYLEPYPMVKEVISKLRRQQIRLGIVTNKRRCTTNIFLNKGGIEISVFEFIITGEDVKRYKPAPDSVLKAIEKLNLPPSKVALVGDTILDIKAAEGAGVVSIGANYGFGKNLQEADLLIESPADLLTLFCIKE
jgi:HAD superfamily hydrolase (TIGR01509 family)